jgi:hypothetical protein
MNGHCYAVHCTTHKRTDKRHGDPLQKPILRSDFKPYWRSIERRRIATPKAPIWSLLPARWDALVSHAKGLVADREAGLPGNRWEHLAAVEVIRVADYAEAEAVWLTAVSVCLLREFDPRRFVTDKSFEFQLGRAVRHLSEASVGSYWNGATGKVTRVYRDPNPRAAQIIGQWLHGAYGVAGRSFAAADRAEAERKRVERAQFHAALGDLEAPLSAALSGNVQAGAQSGSNTTAPSQVM